MDFFENFIEENHQDWKPAGPGIKRKIVAYDDQMMLVKVYFEAGGIGPVHNHFHTQTTYVESGLFEVTVEDKTKLLKGGDVFFVRSNEFHGVKCIQAGMLVDVFHPIREDFI